MLKIGQILDFNPAYLYITIIYIDILIVYLFRHIEIFSMTAHSLLSHNAKFIKI